MSDKRTSAQRIAEETVAAGSAGLLDFEGELRIPAAVGAADEPERLAEHRGLEPAGHFLRLDVPLRPALQDVELNTLAACVGDPVFRDARLPVSLAQRMRVLDDRSRTDHFQDHIHRAYQFGGASL